MVQGGDPTGTGRGGTSIYGEKLYVPLVHLFTLEGNVD
jgi:cyclophilin family peptidyl-prolyl cis-trans isomerase